MQLDSLGYLLHFFFIVKLQLWCIGTGKESLLVEGSGRVSATVLGNEHQLHVLAVKCS